MDSAVLEACALSHTAADGLDAACVTAAAIVWLTQHSLNTLGCTPAALLAHLLARARTPDMRQKLQLLQGSLTQVCCMACLCSVSRQASIT